MVWLEGPSAHLARFRRGRVEASSEVGLEPSLFSSGGNGRGRPHRNLGETLELSLRRERHPPWKVVDAVRDLAGPKEIGRLCLVPLLESLQVVTFSIPALPRRRAERDLVIREKLVGEYGFSRTGSGWRTFVARAGPGYRVTALRPDPGLSDLCRLLVDAVGPRQLSVTVSGVHPQARRRAPPSDGWMVIQYGSGPRATVACLTPAGVPLVSRPVLLRGDGSDAASLARTLAAVRERASHLGEPPTQEVRVETSCSMQDAVPSPAQEASERLALTCVRTLPRRSAAASAVVLRGPNLVPERPSLPQDSPVRTLALSTAYAVLLVLLIQSVFSTLRLRSETRALAAAHEDLVRRIEMAGKGSRTGTEVTTVGGERSPRAEGDLGGDSPLPPRELLELKERQSMELLGRKRLVAGDLLWRLEEVLPNRTRLSELILEEEGGELVGTALDGAALTALYGAMVKSASFADVYLTLEEEKKKKEKGRKKGGKERERRNVRDFRIRFRFVAHPIVEKEVTRDPAPLRTASAVAAPAGR